MEVKPGYKLTEVGVIPEEWDVHPLGTLATMVASGRSSAGRSIGDYPVHGSTGIIGYTWNPEYEGDAILAARVGANAGKLNFVSGKYGVTDNTIILRLSSNCCLPFIWRQLESKRLNRLVFGSGQPLITGTQLKALSLALPPLPEQRAIAEALGYVDGLLDGLDLLITKKRDLKQAAMRQLLTGQTRFPGEWEVKPGYKQTVVGIIPEEWEVAPLSREIEQLEAGVSVNSVDEELRSYAHEQAILKTSAISGGKFLPHEHKKIAPRDIGRAKLNPRRDTIIISRMNTPDLVGECGYVDANYKNLFLPDRLWMTRIRPRSDVCVRWLNYLLSSKPYKARIKELGTGTSGSMKNIAKDALLALPIPYPSGEEQRAIAAALRDMDAELAALEQRREKTRALKQAMMQELLTGKTRLVAAGGSHA